MSWKPKIVAFFCKWCAGSAADLAGVSRLQYPSNIIPIIVPCTGRISARNIIEAFMNGADGVLIGGCHTPNDCHYLAGNFKAFKRVYLLKKLLKQVGIEPERLRIEWISATEAKKLVQVTNEFVKEIKKLGPLHRGE
ncbi:MAG: methyl-viologen-reducing hydrogenase subunit delta [Desulfurococcales archaeon ex4484_58]|nr:MAG: methyl-viologen-reducing hydrogenase subunit delta [Desulfurococcales archaeon ex4484_58]